jgi:hypothetical protein
MKAVETPGNERFMAKHVESDYKEDKETKEPKEHKDSKPPVANKSLSTIHDHSKAAAYLAELTEKIKAEYGQDTLDKLYEQVDQFQSNLSGNGLRAASFNREFGKCAAAERKAENKDFAKLVFLCFTEEIYDNIVNLFSDRPCYQETLKEYSEGIDHAYYSLDQEGRELIGELYPAYITNNYCDDDF